MIWDVAPALLGCTAQQGRLVVTAATEKAERNFLEKRELSGKEGHSRNSAWAVPPQRRSFSMDSQSKAAGQVPHAAECGQIVQIKDRSQPKSYYNRTGRFLLGKLWCASCCKELCSERGKVKRRAVPLHGEVLRCLCGVECFRPACSARPTSGLPS